MNWTSVAGLVITVAVLIGSLVWKIAQLTIGKSKEEEAEIRRDATLQSEFGQMKVMLGDLQSNLREVSGKLSLVSVHESEIAGLRRESGGFEHRLSELEKNVNAVMRSRINKED